MTHPRMPKTAPPLSRRLEAAFARLDPATPIPSWPRAVRIGVDYALRVNGMNPQTDAEADSLAYVLYPRQPRQTGSARRPAGDMRGAGPGLAGWSSLCPRLRSARPAP
jgi:hypothetical protein